MQNSSRAGARRSLLVSLFVIGLLAALFVLPFQFRSKAVNQKENASRQQPGGPVRYENYDIREQKEEGDTLASFRQQHGKTASDVADVRDRFVEGENSLRERVPTLKIEYNTDIIIPEVITPDMWKTTPSYLTAPSTGNRAEILRNFVKQNNELVGVSDQQASELKVIQDYTNPDGNLSFVQLDQSINEIPVFRGEIKAGFTKSGQMIRVINNLAPGIDYANAPTEFGDPAAAIASAAASINHELRDFDTAFNKEASDKNRAVYGTGDWPTKAEKFYFPTEPGVVRAGWRVLIWLDHTAYMFIMDGETGKLLWRKDLGESQTQSATYNVYANTTSLAKTLNSPAPLIPGPTNPTLGEQGPLAARTDVTLIGNEAPYQFNNLGWMTDNTNITDGNNVEAGIDRDGVNGVDAPVTGTARTFSFSYTPGHGSSGAGDNPLTAPYQNGAMTHLFYVTNRYHDEMYRLGFTEQAFNFQHNNFGRGGAGNDRISAQGQDSSGTNNANFGNFGGGVVAPDGNRPQMQMYLWTGPTPDRDGDLDADIVIHELTHGTSSRLHGNTAGITANMTRAMGEGWSDFYAHAMLANPSESLNNVYSTGGYSTLQLGGQATFLSNYYYGIRRFPKAPIAFTGGPNNRPHNPFTFKYINSNCDTFIGTTTTAINSAYTRSPGNATSGSCDQVHNAGEIWSSALWEVRTRMVSRLGFTAGTTRVLQVVTDGMKLAPLNPTFLQERDAIIAAANALPVAPEASADVLDVREGFRVRGMGYSASVQSASPAAVTEAFDLPNVAYVDPFTVSDSTGDNDGFPEPGENVLLSVSVRNNSGGTINNVTANANGGANVSYGNIADGQTVVRQIPYTIPSGATCGSFHNVTINISSAVGALEPIQKSFRLGAPVGGAPATFTNSTLIDLPSGRPTTSTGPGAPYPSNITASGLTGQKVIKVTLNNFSHQWTDDVDILLVGPGGQKFMMMSDVGGNTRSNLGPHQLTFTDGAAAVLPDEGPLASGEYRPTNVDTTTDAFTAPAPASPYSNPAPAGTATFASTFGTDGATMNGTWSLYTRDDTGTDSGSINGGWSITFESDNYQCSISTKSRADFDGDGKSDVAVFRPSDATWYINRSTAGFYAVNWGLSTDALIPGDYDGDGKTDVAVYRPTITDGAPDVFILKSNGNVFTAFPWGSPGDVPVFADYDGDGKTDYAVFRPSENMWYVYGSTVGNQFTNFGQSGDVPVAGDFDGDGKADLTVRRGNVWHTVKSTGGTSAEVFGTAGDISVPADYDGDGKDDVAIFRPSSGTWFYKGSQSGNVVGVPWGQNGDIPVPGDYDGDGKDDQAVYRAGTWYMNQSTAGFGSAVFGTPTDKPVARAYVP